MPTPKNPKHEAFAQAVAGGKNASKAYVLAGLKANRGNASKLMHQQSILQRIDEIVAHRGRAAEKATERVIAKTALSREGIIEMLVDDSRSGAREQSGGGSYQSGRTDR